VCLNVKSDIFFGTEGVLKREKVTLESI
jgi:hypothetical protein